MAELKQNFLIIGNIKIFPETQALVHKGTTVILRKKEFELFEFLLRNKNRVINKLTILEFVWNYSSTISTNTLEVHMNKLRNKLAKIEQKHLIKTYPRLGYMLYETTT